MSLDSDQIEITQREMDVESSDTINNSSTSKEQKNNNDELNSETLPHDHSKTVRSGSTVIKLKIIQPKPPKPEQQQQQQQQNHQEDEEEEEEEEQGDDVEEEEDYDDDDDEKSVSKEPSSDSIDSLDLDQQSSEELHKIYEIYQNRFKSSMKKSNKLFESLQNQTFTLSYYYRRNQSLLTVLDELEHEQQEEGEEEEEDDIGDDDIGDDLMERMKKIIERMPRCKNSLIPFIKLFENQKINKNELIDLYLLEKIPDLINDDLVKLQTNPQSIENWCIRNNPNLINLNYKPITIDNLQDYNSGTEYLLNLNDDFLSNQSSSHRKKRKIDKK